jgi:hypothetical protein
MAITLPRSDLLIKQARTVSGETDYSDGDYGIDTSFFLEALQDAHDYIHLKIINEKGEAFAVTSDEIEVSNLSSIPLPSDILMPHLVYNVEYSQASGGYFENLDYAYTKESRPLNGRLTEYALENGRIYFDRIATSGVVKVRYEQACDRLELRRGKITATNAVSGGSITVDITETVFYKDSDWTNLPEYISVNDRDGNVLMRNIPIVSFDTATGIIVLDTFTPLVTETAPVGAWVVFGQRSTTHSKLPTIALPFFKEYLKTISFEGRSADDISTSNPRMREFLADIIEVYAQKPAGFARVQRR